MRHNIQLHTNTYKADGGDEYSTYGTMMTTVHGIDVQVWVCVGIPEGRQGTVLASGSIDPHDVEWLDDIGGPLPLESRWRKSSDALQGMLCEAWRTGEIGS